MLWSQHYPKLKLVTLDAVLAKVKSAISELELLTDEDKFKLEFVCEELITNSFQHLLSEASLDAGISLQIDCQPLTLIYQEYAVTDLDFARLLRQGEQNQENVEDLIPGGLGLHLISQLATQFSYAFDKDNHSRIFTMLI